MIPRTGLSYETHSKTWVEETYWSWQSRLVPAELEGRSFWRGENRRGERTQHTRNDCGSLALICLLQRHFSGLRALGECRIRSGCSILAMGVFLW